MKTVYGGRHDDVYLLPTTIFDGWRCCETHTKKKKKLSKLKFNIYKMTGPDYYAHKTHNNTETRPGRKCCRGTHLAYGETKKKKYTNHVPGSGT